MVQQRGREGEQLGNYRLERLLGRGGFAEVYLALHVNLQRLAAVKVFYVSLSEKGMADFRREVQIIAALNHPHIIRIFDFDVQRGIPLLVMDYLPHGTLCQRHRRGERVPLSTVVTYVQQVADALQYAHDQRFIHRDVKPENMLIGRRNEIILSDFGIAAVTYSLSSMTNQAFMGTIPYMAPEQIQSQAYAASDQYALAIVAYEWLSGAYPFEGSSYTEISNRHLTMAVPPLCQKVPMLPTEVERVILRALAKDPRQRFSSVQAFATALAEASRAMRPSAGASLSHFPLSPPPTMLTLPSKPVSSTPPAQAPSPIVATAPPAQTPSPITATPSQEQVKNLPERKFSRRAVMVGLAATGVAIGGTLFWLNVVNTAPKSENLSQDAASRIPLYTYRGHTDLVWAVLWSPDGKQIASGSIDNTVQVWDAANGEHIFTYHGHADWVRAVAWSPDGKRLASGGNDSMVQVWDAADGGHVFTYKGHTSSGRAVAWSPDGKRIASASEDSTVQVWDAVDGGNVLTYRGHANYIVNMVAWSPDGKRIASASDDKTVQVWDAVDGGNVLTYKGHANLVWAVAWSPDGKRLASGGWDNTVQVWDAADGKHGFIYKGHSHYTINTVAWSPDGRRIASGGLDKTVQVWDAADGGNVFTYKGHAEMVWVVAWSPDSKRIVSGSRDNIVQVWRAK
jgi:serine/threonine protein kinase